jgi:hypothetical protein
MAQSRQAREIKFVRLIKDCCQDFREGVALQFVSYDGSIVQDTRGRANVEAEGEVKSGGRPSEN